MVSENGIRKGKGLDLIVMTLVLMVIYNLITLTGIHFPQWHPSFIRPVYSAITEMIWVFAILEFFGATTLFVDLIGRWDERKAAGNKYHTPLVIVLVFLFFYKILTWFLIALTPDYS